MKITTLIYSPLHYWQSNVILQNQTNVEGTMRQTSSILILGKLFEISY